MLEAAKSLFLVLSALFPIVDPLGGSPFFLALTSEYAPEARKELSWQIAWNSFFLLVGSYFVGTYILAFFGISLPVVQVGGGTGPCSDRMDVAEAARRRKTRRTQNGAVEGPIPPSILSFDTTADRRPWINLCGGDARCERRAQPCAPSFEYSGCADRMHIDRAQCFSVLRIC